jgi:hypothetical protein
MKDEVTEDCKNLHLLGTFSLCPKENLTQFNVPSPENFTLETSEFLLVSYRYSDKIEDGNVCRA